MSPGTSISAVQSQDWAAVCTSALAALWPRVASPTAQQVAWAAPVSRDPVQQAAQGTGSQALADRVDVLIGLHHSTVMRVQAPHPRVIDLGIPQVPAAVRGDPRSLLLMHLKQDASGDEGLCLQAFPGQGMLVIPVTIVRSDAPSVPEGGCGQILPGILGPRG